MSKTPDCREISQEELDALIVERDQLRANLQHLRSSPAPVVGVVPEMTDDEARKLAQKWSDPGYFTIRQMLKEAFRLGASSLPALKPGGVVVDAKEFSLLSQHWQLWEGLAESEGDAHQDKFAAQMDVILALTDLYALRSAQATTPATRD